MSHPLATIGGVQQEQRPFTPRFSEVAHDLAVAARRLGLVAPAFSSPPRRPDVDRVVRWWPGGQGATIAVRRAARPFASVVDDMVEGVIVVNHLRGVEAARARRQLAEILAPAAAA